MVSSTKICSRLTKEQTCEYYGIFLNSMAVIAQKFGAQVVKNIGDCLLFYFPDTSNYEGSELHKAIECGMTMIDCSDIINSKLHQRKLPSVHYRISFDFGKVMLAKSVTSSADDIFGPTVNLCSKINRYAPSDGMVIGNDLREIVRDADSYEYTFIDEYHNGLKQHYPVYLVGRKKSHLTIIDAMMSNL